MKYNIYRSISDVKSTKKKEPPGCILFQGLSVGWMRGSTLVDDDSMSL